MENDNISDAVITGPITIGPSNRWQITGPIMFGPSNRWQFCPWDGQQLNSDWNYCPKCGALCVWTLLSSLSAMQPMDGISFVAVPKKEST